MEVLQFLKKQGFSEVDVLKGLKADGFGSAQLNRDEFGLPNVPKVFEEKSEIVSEQSTPVDLPKMATPDPFVDKLKGKLGEEVPVALNISSETSVEAPGGKESSQTWANLLKKDAPALSFKIWQKKSTTSPVDNKPEQGATSTEIPIKKDSSAVPHECLKTPDISKGNEWIEVKRKSSGSISENDSPSPTNLFKNLKKVDEIDNKNGAPVRGHKRLTKSQKKRLKAASGTGSPSQS
ncbi:hypothetical protein ACET3Z_021325 [Daucus carota]